MELFNLSFLLLIFTTFSLGSNKELFSVNNFNVLKGIAIVGVFIGHISKIYKGFALYKLFCSLGLFSVALFFFVSGYGLMYGAMKKNNYKDGYLKRRVSPIFFCYFVACIFKWSLDGFGHVPWSKVILCSYVPYSWYILSILLLYVFFYISLLLTKNALRQIAVVIILLSFLIITTYLFDYPWPYPNLGGWQMVCFVLGMITMKFNRWFVPLFNNKYVSSIAIILFFLIWGIQLSDKYIHFPLLLMDCQQNISSYITPFAILSASSCLVVSRWQSVWYFLSSHSLQIYLVHGIVLYWFLEHVTCVNSEILIFVIFAVTILFAMALKRLCSLVSF